MRQIFQLNVHLHHHVLLLPVRNQDQPEGGNINNRTQAALIGQCPNHLRKVATARWVDIPIVFTHSAMAMVIL